MLVHLVVDPREIKKYRKDRELILRKCLRIYILMCEIETSKLA